MCGRFTMSRRDAEELARELGIDPESLCDYRPRYNIAPTDQHWILRVKREVQPALWGLVNSWAKDRKRATAQINARAAAPPAETGWRMELADGGGTRRAASNAFRCRQRRPAHRRDVA